MEIKRGGDTMVADLFEALHESSQLQLGRRAVTFGVQLLQCKGEGTRAQLLRDRALQALGWVAPAPALCGRHLTSAPVNPAIRADAQDGMPHLICKLCQPLYHTQAPVHRQASSCQGSERRIHKPAPIRFGTGGASGIPQGSLQACCCDEGDWEGANTPHRHIKSCNVCSTGYPHAIPQRALQPPQPSALVSPLHMGYQASAESDIQI